MTHAFGFILVVIFGSQVFLQHASARDVDGAHMSLSTLEAPRDTEYTIQVQQVALEAKTTVDQALSEFNGKTLPHEAKDLRKQLVTLRDILDVFSHNFFHELNLWDDVRKQLDKGYAVIGDYKDLFDANPKAVESVLNNRTPTYPDTDKLKDRRKKVLVWKEEYFKKLGTKAQVEELFSNIKPLNRAINYSKKYSRFFWGGVTELPSEFLTPAENARKIIDAQSALAQEEHPAFLNIDDLTSHEGEVVFHDHRKRLRTIVKVCHLANRFSHNSCNLDATENLGKLVVKLGEIEDLIITGRHFEEDNKKKKADESYKSAVKKYKKLKNHFELGNMLEPLERL